MSEFSEQDADRMAQALRAHPNLIHPLCLKIQTEMKRADKFLRSSESHSDLMKMQGKRMGLQELIDFVHNETEPRSMKRKREF